MAIDIQKSGLFIKILKIVEWEINLINKLNPLVNLGIRLWIADIFWKSGVLKLPKGFLGIGKGNWDSTLYLFEFEHPIPFLSVEFAAISGTFFELLCPVLLVLGLGTRFAAFILLVMTAFIEFTYQQHITHTYWMILQAVLIIQGAGILSLDHLIKKKSMKILGKA